MDREALEACSGRWTAAAPAALPADRAHPAPGVAIDGKALRGSRKHGAPLTHLLAAVSHRPGVTLGQVAVAERTNEITAIPAPLRGLLLRGWVVTVDALLARVAVARTILAAGGD